MSQATAENLLNYEYRCEDCGEKFTVQQSLRAHEEQAEKQTCPKCHQKNTRSIISVPSIRTSKKS